MIGTVLAGLLNDGTSGLWSITRLNGTTIVQDPGEADIDSMPLGARAGADRPHPARGRDGAARWAGGPRTAEQRRLSAAGIGRTEGGRDGSCRFSEPVPSRDHALRRAHRSHPPGGRGALVRTREGASARFRCHAGHGFTADALLFSITRTAEEALWGTTRASGDGVMRQDGMVHQLNEQGQPEEAERPMQADRELEQRALAVRELAPQQETMSLDALRRREKAWTA